MSYQRMIPLSLAVIAGVVNGLYVFKPYLEGKDELGKPGLPNSNSASNSTPTPSSALEPPQQPNSAALPGGAESAAKR